jgi:hypothetical protein
MILLYTGYENSSAFGSNLETMYNKLLSSYNAETESIEWFMKDQVFSPSYNSATPTPPPPSPVRKLSLFCRRWSLLTGGLKRQ